MSNLHDFLLEHAKFPFPRDGDRSEATTDISAIEVGLLARDWKGNHAVRDDTLVQKLCQTFSNILGETLLAADAESDLLAGFSPKIQFHPGGENICWPWAVNPGKASVSFPSLHSRPGDLG